MTRTKRIPDDWQARMPDPLVYFAAVCPDMTDPDEHGWASAVCPLARYPVGHRVRIDVDHGRFSCATCGRGDFITFHLLLTRKRYPDCLLDLIENYNP